MDSGETQEELEIIRKHLNFGQVKDTDSPEWQAYPEIPTAGDLNPDWENPKDLEKIHSLLPNTWDLPWADKNTYLETHYRLQREEAISMLRYSIKKYREEPLMPDDEETWVYTKAYVQGYLMTRLGPLCRLQFSTERAGKRVRWNQTRRLPAGGLVALSTAKDNFSTICIPAIIGDHVVREGLDQNPPTINIFWADMKDAVLDPTLELVMVESRYGYFEAVRHCMVGLQHVASTPTPFDKYLVKLDKSDLDAECVRENSEMNLSSLIHHIPGSASLPASAIRLGLNELKKALAKYEILGGIGDDISPYTNLDNSQLGAVHRILTKELAIIQGPPGTGKTFTSVQALNILLDSQPDHGSNPIIVAAQTNHAVDQLLSLLVNRGFNTLRLGGRTQSEEIKKYTLYNLRQRANPPRSNPERDYKALEDARKRNITRVKEMVRGIFPKELLDPIALEEAGLINEQQRKSLQSDDGWEAPGEDRDTFDLLAQWLGDSRIEAPLMDSTNPDFDTEENDDMVDQDTDDFNVELDDCIADDDEDRGKIHGIWIPIKHEWTGSNPRGYTERDRVVRNELKHANLWDVDKQFRGAIYQYWQRQMLIRQAAAFREALVANARVCKNLKANRWQRDIRCIRNASIEIIGCTTTGLCKYRGLIAALKPRVMLIEEAAETKEANILSALYPSLQQLILVGDHQQLAPSCDTPFLDQAPYCLRVSMFERLVKLNMPYTMLNMQRRMNPELRELLSPFYPGLKDHPVVQRPEARPPVPGMSVRSFFLHHTWSEGIDENFSKFNTTEAEMIVHFINYLFMNGVRHSEVTVLTFYRGQRKKLLREFRKLQHREPFKNVHTVDSYQGEENDIVILSLVRSNGPNGPHRAGFLKDSNRAVVALSRARRGIYVFGNMINLEHACDESRKLWGQVRNVFQQRNQYGGNGALPITCQKHQRTSYISDPEDWINHHGGCTEPCTAKLGCGHKCGRRCHWVDHKRLICVEPCAKVLKCGHRCRVLCGQACRCDCPAFTGAYPNDDLWDDKTLGGKAIGSSFPSAPFVGSDGRVGRLRGSRNRVRGGGGGPQSDASPYTSRAPTSPPNQAPQNVDARQRDESQHLLDTMVPLFQWLDQSQGLDQSQRLDQSQGPARADEETVNIIRETFRQVTVDELGGRNIAGVVVSNLPSKPSSEDIAEASSRSSAQADSSADENACSSSVLRPNSVQSSDDSRAQYPRPREASLLSEQNVRLLDNPSLPPLANDIIYYRDVDRAEWEHASAIADEEEFVLPMQAKVALTDTGLLVDI
ncbi:P-loop containing nucleoside triphosphate hydrolase protein [Xylariaceae sp. FL0594]|nr:P-loop containing nucleoside triphosphate hydrolase protein [Xylariaceae sp. FL0594]